MKDLVLLKSADALPKAGIIEVRNLHGNHIGNIFITSNGGANSRYVNMTSSTEITLPYLGGMTTSQVRDVFKSKSTLLSGNPVYKSSLYIKTYRTPHFPTFKDDKKYILWCPTSHLPPRVILEGMEEARKVAKEMTERHGSEFIICELKESYSRKKKVTTTYETVTKTL